MSKGNAYSVVKMFEDRVADHFGLKHGVAVDCCTHALFLSLMYRKETRSFDFVRLPKRTYPSVPFAIMDAGLRPLFMEGDWEGHYTLYPWGVVDAAKLWKDAKRETIGRGQDLWCTSFHFKKSIPIGRGGMILTDDDKAVEWLRKARYDGRTGKPLGDEKIVSKGWHFYMTPEQAARGMALMDVWPDGMTIPPEIYPDLSTMEAFNEANIR